MKIEHLALKFAVGDLSGKPDGFIAGIASTPRVDSYNDVVLPGAFDESIKARGNGGFGGPDGIAMLAYHDSESPVGVWDVIETRGDALYVEGRLNLEVDDAKELYSHTKMGGAIGLSIGFRIQSRTYEDENDATKRIISKGDIREISLVTFPSNEDCAIVAVKSAAKKQELETFASPSDFVKWAMAEFTLSRRMGDALFKVAKANGHLFVAADGHEPNGEMKPVLPMSADYSTVLHSLTDLKNAELAALIRSQADSFSKS